MEASTSGQQQQQQQADRLESEAHEGTTPPTKNGRSSGACQQQEENDPEQVPVTTHTGLNGCEGDEPSADAGIVVGGGRAEECFNLYAEAFADDLDLLRQGPTFTGSSKNIVAMADMMR